MCMMMAGVLGAGLQMMGSIAQYQQQEQQTKEYNREAAQNRLNASVAAANKYADQGRNFVYNSRELQQEGNKAALAGMRAQGATRASTGSAGFDLGSTTVNSILADEDSQTAAAMANLKTKQDNLSDSYRADAQSTEAEAQNRINSMPDKPMPNPLTLGLNIATAGLGAVKGFIQ